MDNAGFGDNPAVDVTAVIILCVIIILSTTCNTTAIYHIRNSSKKSLKEKIVLLLCTINLFQALGGYSIELHAAFTGGIKSIECQIQGFIVCLCTYSNIGLFVSLTIHKYLIIIYPFQSDRWLKGRFIPASFLIVPLITGFILGTPPLLGWGKYWKPRNESFYCSYVFENMTDRAFFLSAVVCGFAIPAVLASICLKRIVKELRRATYKYRRRYGKSSSISADSSKRVQEQELHSVLTGVVYFLSWSPYCTITLLLFFQQHVPKELEYFSICMCKSSTVSSALLFCLIEKRARQYIKEKVSLVESAVMSPSIGTDTTKPVSG